MTKLSCTVAEAEAFEDDMIDVANKLNAVSDEDFDEAAFEKANFSELGLMGFLIWRYMKTGSIFNKAEE